MKTKYLLTFLFLSLFLSSCEKSHFISGSEMETLIAECTNEYEGVVAISNHLVGTWNMKGYYYCCDPDGPELEFSWVTFQNDFTGTTQNNFWSRDFTWEVQSFFHSDIQDSTYILVTDPPVQHIKPNVFCEKYFHGNENTIPGLYYIFKKQ